MTCQECGASTLGYQVTTQGGTRLPTIVASRPRGRVLCRTCCQDRCDVLTARERATR